MHPIRLALNMVKFHPELFLPFPSVTYTNRLISLKPFGATFPPSFGCLAGISIALTLQ